MDAAQPQLPFETDAAPGTNRNVVGDRAETAGPVKLAHPPMLLTVRDVEAELQLGRTRTYELIRSGELPVVRLGRVVRVPRDALHRWIDAKSGGTDPTP